MISQTDRQEILGWSHKLQGPGFNWPKERLQQALEDLKSLLSRDDLGQVRAFLLWQELPQALEIMVLGTHPQFSRQGRMAALLANLIAEHQGSRELWLEVHAENTAARKLYEKFGFKEMRQRPRYYIDGAAAILYSRSPNENS